MKINDYSAVVSDAIAKQSEKDNWGWYIVDEFENEIIFNWGYFEYLEEDEKIIVTIEECDDDVIVKAYTTKWGITEVALIGNDFWDDAKTIEKGIEIVINDIIHILKDIY